MAKLDPMANFIQVTGVQKSVQGTVLSLPYHVRIEAIQAIGPSVIDDFVHTASAAILLKTGTWLHTAETQAQIIAKIKGANH